MSICGQKDASEDGGQKYTVQTGVCTQSHVHIKWEICDLEMLHHELSFKRLRVIKVYSVPLFVCQVRPMSVIVVVWQDCDVLLWLKNINVLSDENNFEATRSHEASMVNCIACLMLQWTVPTSES
jgi:hypothetical protein